MSLGIETDSSAHCNTKEFSIIKSVPGFPTGLATIQFEESCYSVAEGEQVSVCAELILPDGTTSLGCDISVLFSATNGDRAGL